VGRSGFLFSSDFFQTLEHSATDAVFHCVGPLLWAPTDRRIHFDKLIKITGGSGIIVPFNSGQRQTL
jgi:hypothetical protein